MGQKLRLANWQIAQANSHMLAERNLGRDRVRSWLSDHFVNPNWRFGDVPIVAGNSAGHILPCSLQ
uniref:Uncharacterized protein n=1 Tax=Oryza glumipatula TaxID=40148 RepID=A0A0D9ZMD9_9ORYZ